MKNSSPRGKSANDFIRGALEHFQRGRTREAEATCREALKLAPSNFDALHLLGVIANQSGNIGQAIELIGRAIHQDPVQPYAHNNLGLALQTDGKLEEASASYRKALSIKPDFTDAHFNLGNVLQAQGKFDEAIASYGRALELQPQDAEAHNNLGSALRSQGKLEEAVASFRKATALSPGYAEAYNNLGATLQEQGKLDEAAVCLDKALALKPNYAEAYNNLGATFWRGGELDKAIASFGNALSIKPGYVEVHINLGNVLQKQGRFDDAIAAYHKAISLMPGQARVYTYLGNALRRQGKNDEAESSFRQALSINPGLAEGHIGIAELNIDIGQFDAAHLALAKALDYAPNHHSALALLSTVRKMTTDDEPWLETVLNLVNDGSLPWEEMIPMQFAIGKYYDDTRQYDLAFAAYRKANMLKRQVERKFDRTGFSSLIDNLITIYNADFMKQRIDGASSSQLPVLVVGMPRSGTSLTEQIIASHPDAFGAGELIFWGEQVDIHRDMVFSGNYDVGSVAQLSAEYTQCLRRCSADASRIVDKMPGNFLWLGFIHAVFPNARIIHTRRNPLDTCLSVYFQDLLPGHSYGSDLDDLAFYYREYDRLMRHWRGVLSADQFLEISYEELIDSQEEWSRKIIQFIGLEWNESCLDFQATKRKVGTGSNWQVRQKIYHTSKERWKNYEKHMGPLSGLSDPG